MLRPEIGKYEFGHPHLRKDTITSLQGIASNPS